MADPGDNEWVERRNRILDARDRGDESYLIDALVDPENRGLAANCLGELGSDSAVEPLLRLFAASDRHVRAAAAGALGKIGSADALTRLREVAGGDEEPMVRMWAIGALGKIGDPKGVELILPMLLDRSWRVRGAAAQALGDLGDPRALDPLSAARRRLRRSPVEWWAYRGIYNDAIDSLSSVHGS